MKVRKITSLILCAAITANLLVSSASAYSEAGESRVYTYNGYTVEYKIVNEWTGNQNIEITVTNTGDEILADWAMGYNASGEINGLWNAQVYAVQGTEYILKGADYNSEIAPGEAVRFGYILSGEEFKYPQNIFNCAKRVDISDNYDVYYNITGDYGDTYQAEMTLVNLSDTDYSAWQLSFEGNATIDNLWNAKLLENDGGSFKVKNAEHNSVICAGDSVSFNFSGTKLFKDDEETSDIAGTSEAQTVEATEESQPDITDESENVQTETSESAEPQTDSFGRYDDIKVYVYYQRFGSNFKVTNNLLSDPETGENYFTCYEDAEAALDRLERYLIRSSFWAYDYVEATQFMIDTCDENIIAMYHITADDRVMGSVSSAKKLLQTVQNSKYTTRDEEEINRIYVSLLCPNSDKVIDPDSYAAQLVEASGGIIYTAVEEKMEIQPVLFAAAQTSVYAADSESEEPLIKPGSFADTVRKNVTGILGEGNGCEYQVISSTGLTTIKLDKPLTKGSKTDTDYDGLSDWDEVNTDLIIKMYAEKHSDYNWLKYGKWQMPTSTLPTFGELYYTYDKLFYVQNGLGKWLQASASSGDPYRVINGRKVLPIISNPVDADSDNDGIPDFCDLNRLIKGDVFDDMDTISYPRSDHNNDTFTVVSEFSCHMIFKRQPYNQINVYSLPKQTSKMPFVYSYSSNETIHAYAVVKNTDGYWIKVMNKNNGKMGYVKWGNRNIIDEFSVVNNVINRFETKTTKLLLSHDDIVNALKESKCLKGDESIDNINSKLLKTTYENGGAFSYKSAPYGVIKNSEFAYLDENDLYRVEMSNKIDNVDFYTVAISDQLMKTAYDSLMESIPDTLTKSRAHYGGFRFLVKLVGDNGEMRYINMISSDAKSDLKWANDKDEGNSLFPVSRDRNGKKLYCNDGSVEYHDHLFEFVVNNRPNDDIVINSNVDYDKLLGVPSDTNLKVYEVYLYIDEPLVAGVWGGYYDYDKYIW